MVKLGGMDYFDAGIGPAEPEEDYGSVDEEIEGPNPVGGVKRRRLVIAVVSGEHMADEEVDVWSSALYAPHLGEFSVLLDVDVTNGPAHIAEALKQLGRGLFGGELMESADSPNADDELPLAGEPPKA